MIDRIMMQLSAKWNANPKEDGLSIMPALDIEKSMFTWSCIAYSNLLSCCLYSGFYSKMSHEEFDRKAALSFQQALKSGVRTANQFKIVVIGPEGAGKTSTIDALLGKMFQPNQSTTVGAKLNKCTVDRILVSKWQESNLKDHIEELPKQYSSEMKLCMSQMSRKSDITVLAKAKNSIPQNCASFVSQAKKVIKSKTVGGSRNIKIIIYDIGGQEIYQVIRCFFLASEDIVFVVFNASIGLDGQVETRQRWTRFKKKVEAKGTQTNLEAIEMALNSVYSNSNDDKIQSTSNRTPIVFMIATHAKGLTGDQREEMTDKIYEKFSGRPFMDHLPKSKNDAIHFIDNFVRDPEAFEHLKEVVMAAANCVIKKKCPIPYLQFESEILKTSITKTSITKEEATAIAKKSNLQEDVELILHHFHQKGILQYYAQVKSLQNIVFISPQEVSDNVSTVISTHNCEPTSAKLQKSCNRYETYGILEEALLDHMLEAHNCAHKKSILLGLLEMFDLAVTIPNNTRFIDEDQSYSTPTSGRVFLIPSMLTYNEKKIYHKNEGDVVIQFHFPDKFLPETFFNRVLVKTVVWCYKNDHEIRG